MLIYRKPMPATLDKKPRKISASAKVRAKKSGGESFAAKPSKTLLSKKPFAYLIGCIEGAPDLSTRKGYHTL